MNLSRLWSASAAHMNVEANPDMGNDWKEMGKAVLNGVLHPDSLILSSNNIKIGPGLFPRLKGALLNDLRINCPKFSLKKNCFADVRGVIRCKTMALL